MMLALALASAAALQEPDTTRPAAPKPVVTFGAFVDAYYAWDTGRPAALDRAFTTQPARHNEFNVNLAHVEARLAGERVRGRLALQAGTSVQANYLAEPGVGTISGGELSRHLQEAVIGVRLGAGLWLDGGIYFSHIGLEGWLSRDNPTYTRSLVADYTPYYLSGVKLTWTPGAAVTAQLHLVNGWQNISETNGDKALGARLDWQATPRLVLGYANFVGNEQPDDRPARTRMLHQAMLRWSPADGWALSAVGDLGAQEAADDGWDTWYGVSLIARRQVSARVALAGRVERYADPGEVIVPTGTPNGFETWSASLGADVQVSPELLWRTEARAFRSSDAVWPDRAAAQGRRGTGLLVTSLALTL